MGTNVGTAYVNVTADTSALTKQVNAAGAGITKSMGKFAAAAGVAFGAAFVVKGIGNTISEFTQFERTLAKIEGLVGIAGSEVQKFGELARDLGPSFGKGANEAADAMFYITSAGLRGADATSTLEASLKASAIGLGDTATVADLATSAMNAYGSNVLSASAATDVMVATVREGKLSSEELADSMGRTLPLASAMGVEFNEVGAAFAALSRTGTNASEAATQIRGIMAGLLRPTAIAQEELAKYGLTAQQLRDKMRGDGLLSTLKLLTKTLGGNEESTAKVFGNIRALSGVLDLMGKNVKGTEAIFESLTDTTGDTNDAFTVMEKTAGFKLDVALSKMKDSLISIGAAAAPIAVSLVEGFQSLLKAIKPPADALRSVANTMWTVLGPAVTAVASGLQSLVNFLSKMTSQVWVAQAAVIALASAWALGKFTAVAAAIATLVTRTRALAVSTTAAATAQMRLAPGLAATGLAASGMGRALIAARTAMTGLLASIGPIGWAAIGIGAITAGIMALRNESRRAVQVMTPLLDTIEGTDQQIKNLKRTLTGSTNSLRDFAQAQVNSKRAMNEVKQASRELAQARQSGNADRITEAELRYEQAVINSSQAAQDANRARDAMGVSMSKQRQGLVAIRDGLMTLYSQEKLSEGQIKALGDSYSAFGYTAEESLAIARKPLKDQTAKLREGLKQTSRQLANINTPEVKKFKTQVDKALKAPNNKEFIKRIDDIGLNVKGTRKVVGAEMNKARATVEKEPKATWKPVFSGISFGAETAAADTKAAVGQVPKAVASQEAKTEKASQRVAKATTAPLKEIGTGISGSLNSNFGSIDSTIGSWEEPLVSTTAQAVRAVNAWLRKIGDRSSPKVAKVVGQNMAKVMGTIAKAVKDNKVVVSEVKKINAALRKVGTGPSVVDKWAKGISELKPAALGNFARALTGVETTVGKVTRTSIGQIARLQTAIGKMAGGEAKDKAIANLSRLANALQARLQRLNEVAETQRDRFKSSVDAWLNKSLEAYDRLTQGAIDALNRRMDELTDEEVAYNTAQGQYDTEQDARRITELTAAMQDAEAAYQAAAAPDSGAWQEDIDNAYEQFLAAQQALADEQRQQELNALRESADEARRVKEQQRARELADLQARRENQRVALEQMANDQAAALMRGEISATQFREKVTAEFAAVGVSANTIGSVVGVAMADQWGRALADMTADALTTSKAVAALLAANSKNSLGAAIIALRKAITALRKPKKRGGGSKSKGKTRGVPELAQGGVITRPTLAMIGENRRTAPEIVTPEKLMRQIVSEEGGMTHVRVFIGDKELTDLVRTEISDSNRSTSRTVMAGAR